MKEKFVIITGANSGIGASAALRFATEGWTVIMACRNLEKANSEKSRIISSSGNKRVFVEKLDMSSFQSIHDFCYQLKTKYKYIDILINNAAYFNHGEEYKLSEDKVEITFATNVVGPYLLTSLLIPVLKESEDARVLNVSSNITKHFFDQEKKLFFDNLFECGDSNHSVYKRYRNSKMALVMLTFKMAAEYADNNIKVNAIQVNGAKMSKDTIEKFKSYWRLLAHIQNLFFPKTEYMADNYYEICTSDKFIHTSGKLINDKLEIMQQGHDKPRIADILGRKYYPKYADNKEDTEKVWNLCKKLTQN